MKSKGLALFAVVLIALAVLGFTYAYWTETLYIEGSIETGKLDVAFTGTPTASCSDYMECTVDLENGDDTSKMTVMVSNAYPSGWCNVTFEIHNCGTIPAKVKAINIPEVSGLTISIEDLSVGQEIGVSKTASATLKIHVGDVVENSQYTFAVSIEFTQWNAP